jgi:hypothetical protein
MLPEWDSCADAKLFISTQSVPDFVKESFDFDSCDQWLHTLLAKLALHRSLCGINVLFGTS